MSKAAQKLHTVNRVEHVWEGSWELFSSEKPTRTLSHTYQWNQYSDWTVAAVTKRNSRNKEEKWCTRHCIIFSLLGKYWVTIIKRLYVKFYLPKPRLFPLANIQPVYMQISCTCLWSSSCKCKRFCGLKDQDIIPDPVNVFILFLMKISLGAWPCFIRLPLSHAPYALHFAYLHQILFFYLQTESVPLFSATLISLCSSFSGVISAAAWSPVWSTTSRMWHTPALTVRATSTHTNVYANHRQLYATETSTCTHILTHSSSRW